MSYFLAFSSSIFFSVSDNSANAPITFVDETVSIPVRLLFFFITLDHARRLMIALASVRVNERDTKITAGIH